MSVKSRRRLIGATGAALLLAMSCGCTAVPEAGERPFVFSPYKDLEISRDPVTHRMATTLTGRAEPVWEVLPGSIDTLSWAFATGACAAETWAGVPGAAIASANIPAFVGARKKYIVSTGGLSGSFTCRSDSAFEVFVKRYESEMLLGFDFDIEGTRTAAELDDLVGRIRVAQARRPHLRWSFTLATLGGDSPQALAEVGVMTMKAIRKHRLQGYLVNLMAMNYGSPTSGNCVVGPQGRCDMGRSAIQAAMNLHEQWNVPFDRIELTVMIGGNDVENETFTLADVKTVTAFAKTVGLAGLHYWSVDRDRDCPTGAASPVCNTEGRSGTLGFTKAFVEALHQNAGRP